MNLTVDSAATGATGPTVSGAAGGHNESTPDQPTSRRSKTRPVDPLREILAAVALAGYSTAVAAGFARVFEDWSFFVPLVTTAIAVHAWSLLGRLLRARLWIVIPTQVAFGIWVGLRLQFGETLRFGIPTSQTLAQVSDAFETIRALFPTAVAPVPPITAWMTLATLGVLVAAVCGDLFAFPARAVGESLSAGAVIFIFVATLGDDRNQILLTALLVSAGVITIAALTWHHDREPRLRIHRAALPSAAPAVIIVAIVVAMIGAFVGPRLPGADADALVDPKGNSSDEDSQQSPLVDIKSRLTNQSQTVMFRIEATKPSYWRTTTLPNFDGQSFSLPSERLYRSPTYDQGLENPNLQTVTIAGLKGEMVPAAANPIQADGVDPDGDAFSLRINLDTSTLLAPESLTPSSTFRVVSDAIEVTPDQLQAAPTDFDLDPTFLEVPDDLPDVVNELAVSATAGAQTEYDKMLALQNWFRSDFTYSLDIEPGHGSTEIERFLNRKSGYCEQFSATFAAMARTLGVPSRVAVGYTQGDLDPDGRLAVRGRNAHAWPEVWFEGVGWVPFEPTPGRGIPGATNYTGVEAEQAPQQEQAPTPEQTTPPETLPPTPVTAPPVPTSVAVAPTDTPSGQGLGRLLRFFGVAVLVVLLASIPWLLRRVRRRAEDRLAPPDRSIHAWHRCQRAAVAAGVRGGASSTTAEWIDKTAEVSAAAAAPMATVGTAYDRALYGPPGTLAAVETDGVEPGTVDLVERGGETVSISELADEVERALAEELDARQRVGAWFRVN